MLSANKGITLITRLQEIPSLTDGEFERVRHFARAACGISLQLTKKALVSSRLERVLRRNGWESYGKYLDVLASKPGTPEWTEFIDCLTTNHSGFFREMDHFAFLEKEVFGSVTGPLRIWSAACATGEEPYSIAMAAFEAGIRDVEILATDISTRALKEAENGIYDPSRLAGLESSLRSKYMTNMPGATPKALSIVDRVRKAIRFQQINLLRPLDGIGRFHVVFCRNVMIYFDRETQDALVARLSEHVLRDGFLFTGHSESLLSLPKSLEYVKPAVYRKVS